MKYNYNPFAEKRAQQGPFEGIQYVVSDTTDQETFFDYTHLSSGRFNGKSILANFPMLTFTAKRFGSRKWLLTLQHENYVRGSDTKKREEFTIQLFPETCRVYIAAYDRSIKDLQADITLANGYFIVQGKTVDDTSEGVTPYTLKAQGTEQDATFTYTQGENSYQIRWKDHPFYDNKEEAPELDDKIIFLTDNISWLRVIINDEVNFCKYFSAIGK